MDEESWVASRAKRHREANVRSRSMSGQGRSTTVLAAPKRHFRTFPNNGHRQTAPACLKRCRQETHAPQQSNGAFISLHGHRHFYRWMDIAPYPVGARLVELEAQQFSRLLQAEVHVFLAPGSEDVDVMYDVVVVGEAQAVA